MSIKPDYEQLEFEEEMFGPDREELAFQASIMLDLLEDVYAKLQNIDESDTRDYWNIAGVEAEVLRDMAHCEEAIALFDGV